MVGLRKLLGGYLIVVAVFVASWFVVNPFFDAPAVWDVANYLMAAALLAALAFSVDRIFKEARELGPSASRGHMEANPGLYLTAGVAILFFRNWFLEISGQGEESSVATGIVWIVVNVLFPLVSGLPDLPCGATLRKGDDHETQGVRPGYAFQWRCQGSDAPHAARR